MRLLERMAHWLVTRWCECPEVTEIHPDDRDPETETLWRETRQYLEGVSAPALPAGSTVQGGGHRSRRR